MCLAYSTQYGKTRFAPVISDNAHSTNDNFDPHSFRVLLAPILKIHDAKEKALPFVEMWVNGTTRRDFVHAGDIADACPHRLRQDVSAPERSPNIGAGSDMSLMEPAEIVCGVAGYKGPLEWSRTKQDAAPCKLLDHAGPRSLGWSPKIDFHDGIGNTYE